MEKEASQKRSSNTKLLNKRSEQYVQVTFFFQIAKYVKYDKVLSTDMCAS